jgi:adenine-specific DNA methylase
MMHVRFPLSLRNVEDFRFERGIDICHETVRFWWKRTALLYVDVLSGAKAAILQSLISEDLREGNAAYGYDRVLRDREVRAANCSAYILAS